MSNVVREKATAVYTAFRRLDAESRRSVVARMLKDRKLREDLLDIATIEHRRNEPSRPLRDYLASRKKS